MRFLNSKIFTVLAGIVTLWFVFSSINLNSQRNTVNKDVKNIEAKIHDIQEDIGYFNKFSAYFKTSAFLEKEARLKLNYKAQGEDVVFIYRDKNVKKASESVNFEKLLESLPNYQKWFFYLLGY